MGLRGYGFGPPKVMKMDGSELRFAERGVEEVVTALEQLRP